MLPQNVYFKYNMNFNIDFACQITLFYSTNLKIRANQNNVKIVVLNGA